MGKLYLSSEDCETLAALQERGTVSKLAIALNLDKGFLSRKIAQIAAKAPVLDKTSGRWALTDQGRSMAQWYRDSLEIQKQILRSETTLKIGTTQPLSERVLIPILQQLKQETSIRVKTEIVDFENELLEGHIDIGLTRGIPTRPEIRYRKLFDSDLAIVHNGMLAGVKANPLLFLETFPYVTHSALNLREILQVRTDVPPPIFSLDHISGVRECVIKGFGWSVLPRFAIFRELNSKELSSVAIKDSPVETVNLWWAPSRTSSKRVISLISALKSKNSGLPFFDKI